MAKQYNKLLQEQIEIHYDELLIKKYDIDKIYHDLTKKLDFNSKTEIIKSYLKNIIIGNIKYSEKQYNCSFIDIIGSKFSLYKTGFSGTLNFNLPEFRDNNLEFTKLEIIPADIGSTYVAILNLLSENKNENLSDFIINPDSPDILEKITGFLKNYNSLIDNGAFLKNINTETVIDYFSKNLNYNYYIYIDKNDTKLIYNKKINKISIYNQEIFETQDLFIYYDNRHVVGIDIKQPFYMKGLVTVDIFNRYTDTSQSIFRLRYINYGHLIDFLISYKLSLQFVKKILNRINLLYYLIEKDNQYKNQMMEYKRLLQNIKYLVRDNYQENKYIEFYYFKYQINPFESWKKNIVEPLKRDDPLVIKLIKKLENLYINYNKSGIYEQEQEKEKKTEKQTEIQTEHQLINNFKIDCFKTDGQSSIKISDKYSLLINSSESNFYKLLLSNNIFVSKKFIIKSHLFYIETDTPYNILLNQIHNLSLFYLKNNNNYIILDATEAEYLKLILPDLEIKNKLDLFKSNQFIRFLLAAKLKFSEYLLLAQYIFQKPDLKSNLSILLNCLEDDYGQQIKYKLQFYNSKIINLIYESVNYQEFINKINNMDATEFIEFVSNKKLEFNINKEFSNLILIKKTEIINKLINQKGGFYYKYKKYKNKYYLLKYLN